MMIVQAKSYKAVLFNNIPANSYKRVTEQNR